MLELDAARPAAPAAAPPGARRRGALDALPLAWRIFLGTSLVVAIVLGGALAWTARSAARAAAVGAARGVAALDAEAAAYLEGDARALEDGAAVFARSAGFRAVIASGARADALDQAREAADQLRAAWVQLVDARGVRLAKSDAPGAPAEPLGDSPLVRAALAGRAEAGFGALGDSALAHVAAVPIEGATPGVIVGALMVARPLDARAARGQGAEGGEVVFYVLPRGAGPRVAASTLTPSPALAGALAALPDTRGEGAGDVTVVRGAPGEVVVAGTRYLARAHPLRSSAGRVLGGYAVLRSRDVEYAAFEALRRATLVAGGVGLLAALLVSSAIARQVTRPLAALADAARRAAEGDYSASFAVRPGRDEVGTVAAAFHTLLDDLRAKQVLVEFARLARGRVPSGRQRALGPGRRATPPRPAEATLRLTRDGAAASAGDTPTLDAGTGAAAAPGTAVAAAVAAAGLDGLDEHPTAADVVAAAEALRPGQLFAARYLVEAMIGAGGSGVVFRVQDAGRGGEVLALKVLRPDVAQNDPAALARLAREVDTARQLAHPNLVRVYDLDEAEGIHFLTMEYVEGRSLRDLIDDRGALPVPAAVSVARQLCRALAHAHERGVLHRDVKPHNAVITPDGVLKVMDFGAARFAEVPRGVTETGALVGTPAYMAPEVLRGARHDERSDVYAAGVVLYESLTGRPPFESASSPLVVVTHVLEDRPADPCALNPAVPRPLCDLVLGALEKDPAARPPSAEAFERQLAAFA
jgi:serine/threonine-protein kinase